MALYCFDYGDTYHFLENKKRKLQAQMSTPKTLPAQKTVNLFRKIERNQKKNRKEEKEKGVRNERKKGLY